MRRFVPIILIILVLAGVHLISKQKRAELSESESDGRDRIVPDEDVPPYAVDPDVNTSSSPGFSAVGGPEKLQFRIATGESPRRRHFIRRSISSVK